MVYFVSKSRSIGNIFYETQKISCVPRVVIFSGRIASEGHVIPQWYLISEVSFH